MGQSLLFSREFGVHIGAQAVTSRHQMYMAKLVVPLDGRLLYSSTSGRESIAVEAPLVVAPGHDHLLGADAKFVAFFAHPQEKAGSTLAAATPSVSPLRGLLGTRITAFARTIAAQATQDDLGDVQDELLHLLERPRIPCLDPRIEKAQQVVTESRHLPDLDALADAVELSRFRLSHLFREETGTTLRRFLLWEKFVRALELIVAGDSITTAAHAAAFSDHAHLTRTTRKLVGQPPSYLNKALVPET